jgi:AraC-like DNA-binding protein
MEYGQTDVLADILDALRLRGRVFCRCELSAPWALGFAEGGFSHFHVIERGKCWFRLHGQAEGIAVREGDLLLVPRGHGYQISDGPATPPIQITDLVGSSQGGLRAVLKHGGGGAATNIICGSFEIRGAHARSFLSVLPEWIRVETRGRRATAWLSAMMRFMRRETRQRDIGAETIITRLTDVMFVQALRAWLKDQPAGSAGWLGALKDPAIGTALRSIHSAPEKSWTVPALAAEVGMSRSPFAARFTALVGEPPMAYLKQWRMQVAAELLQTGTLTLSGIADRVGYESTAALSRVFRQQFGVSPGQFRRTPRVAVRANSGRTT